MSTSPDASWSAEEFYVDLLARINVFTDRSRAYATAGQVEAAVVSQWGADVLTLQSVAWERIVVVSSAPQEPLFEIGARVLDGLGARGTQAASQDLAGAIGLARAAAGLVAAARDAMVASIDDGLRSELITRLQPLDHLESLKAPSAADFSGAARSRLAGMSPEDFVARRRLDAAARMEQARRISEGMVAAGPGADSSLAPADSAPDGSATVSAAIAAAYEADMLTLDAYLVESAVAIGDDLLFTVQLRWDYAAAAVTRLAGVPADLGEAVALVRRTLARSLGAGDGARLERTWIPLD